ncbi:MAG: lipoprotein-releasing ABC transporter permease subunit [Holosporales bacterium]|nr:lipoprotein-releasing ABC transporter permease subunit [Holosporales bacterium]
MFEIFIARRYLHASKGAGFARIVTWFSFIGIALGVATLIVVTSVMNGFKIELLNKIIGMKGHIIISSTNYAAGINDYEKLVEQIMKCDDAILQVIPQIEQQAVLISNGSARGVLVHGLSVKSLASKNLLSNSIEDGSIKNFDGQQIFLGKRLSEIIGISLNDQVKLLIPDGIITPFGKLPKEEAFDVSGIFNVGMNEYDKSIVLMPLATAQQFFNLTDKILQIEVLLKDIDMASKISQKIQNILGNNFSVLDWQHSDANIFHAVVVEKNVMTLILSIIILVAIFNIISSLTMLTNSKIRDIAILKTIGVTRRSVLKIFFLIGTTIGITGTLIGGITGIMVASNIDKIKKALEGLSVGELFNEEIYFLSQLPSQIDWLEVAYILSISIILCLLATLYPAIKSSRLDPAEALRT